MTIARHGASTASTSAPVSDAGREASVCERRRLDTPLCRSATNGTSTGGSGGRDGRPRGVSLIREVVQAAAPGAIDLALGEPVHAPPAAALAALRACAAEDLRYTANAGLPELRAAVAGSESLHGGGAESVLVTVGSQQSLALACLGLLSPGDEVLLADVCYPSYEALARFAGADIRRVSWDHLEAALSPRTRLLIVGSPANPTSLVLDGERLRALDERAALCGAWIVLDRVYAPLLDPPQPPVVGGRVLVVGSVSKSFALTGLRVGWLVAPPAVVAELLPLHQHLVTCAPRLAQTAALAALASGEETLVAARALYRERRRLALRSLTGAEGIRVVDPGVGFYLWLDARERLGADSLAFALGLARAGSVLVVPGEAFGAAGAGYLRVSVAASVEHLVSGLDRLVAALSDERS